MNEATSHARGEAGDGAPRPSASSRPTSVARWLLSPATWLAALERALLALPAPPPAAPQLFILGLPRSGTTLVSQYLVHRLEVAYFTNGVGRWPRSAALVTLVQRLLNGEHASDFTSRYGRTRGATAPREAGAFWGRSFRLDDYDDGRALVGGRLERLRRTIWTVQHAFGGAPFVNKNVKHLLRFEALARVFPKARFLVVDRDERDVALSVLRGRLAETSDASEWWSVRPPEYDAIRALPLVEQVARQVVGLRRRLEDDLARISADRVVRQSYEAFCDAPEALVERLRGVLGPLDYRNPPVERFERRAHEARTEQEREVLAALESLRREEVVAASSASSPADERDGERRRAACVI